MQNLDSTNINLRTLNVSSYAELIANLNFNFTQVLQLPGFRGIDGYAGVSGGVGEDGERGSNWIFVNVESFKTNYNSITTAGQITGDFINYELSNDIETLLLALNIDSLVNNDVLVTPDGIVYQFDQTNVIFNQTQITFVGSGGLTQQQVIDIVSEMLSVSPNNVAIFKTFKAFGKNFADVYKGINDVVNTQTTIDADVLGGEYGSNLLSYQFISLLESISNLKSNIFVFGELKKYHDILQSTLLNLSTNYAPKQADSPALVVMQDNRANGLMIGYKDADSFKEFARIFHDGDSLKIISGYGDDSSLFGVFNLKKENGSIITDVFTFPKQLDVLGIFNSPNINDILTEVILGNNNTCEKITVVKPLIAKSFTSEDLKNAEFLSTDSNGKIIKSANKLAKLVNIASNSDTEVPTTALIKELFYTKALSDARYLQKSNNLSEVNKADARNNLEVYSKNEVYTKTQSDTNYMPKSNKLFHTIVCIGDTKDVFGSLTNFDLTGKGIVGTDREGWAICNGQNNTPDVRGRVVFYQKDGDVDFGTVGNSGGGKEITLSQVHIPRHSHWYSTVYVSNTPRITNNNIVTTDSFNIVNLDSVVNKQVKWGHINSQNIDGIYYEEGSGQPNFYLKQIADGSNSGYWGAQSPTPLKIINPYIILTKIMYIGV